MKFFAEFLPRRRMVGVRWELFRSWNSETPSEILPLLSFRWRQEDLFLPRAFHRQDISYYTFWANKYAIYLYFEPLTWFPKHKILLICWYNSSFTHSMFLQKYIRCFMNCSNLIQPVKMSSAYKIVNTFQSKLFRNLTDDLASYIQSIYFCLNQILVDCPQLNLFVFGFTRHNSHLSR